MNSRATRYIRFAFLPLAAASLMCAPAARASITPDAQKVVDRYVEVTGGREAFDAQRTLHVRGKIAEIGLSGTYEAWVQWPDRMVTRISLGSLKVRTGVNGSRAWHTDLNLRNLAMLDGKDLEQEQAEVWFQTEQWARTDQGGGTITLGSRAYTEDVTDQVLQVVPPRGPMRRLWFNAKSGLLEKVVVVGDLGEAEENRYEFKKVNGRKLATQLRGPVTAWDDHRDEGLTLDSLWANVDLDSTLFEPPTVGLGPISWLKTPHHATVPFRYGTRHVWIKASINGAPMADFMLDTGCSLTTIDRGYALQMGLPLEGKMTVYGIGGTDEAAFTHLTSLRVSGPNGDGVAVGDLRVSLLDFGDGFEEVAWRKCAGLIGYDFISRFVTEIDYDHGTVTFTDPKTFVYKGAGQGIPMGLADDVPTVHLALNAGCEGEFLVDVGNGFGLAVHGSAVRRCSLLQSRGKEVEVWTGGIGGAFIATLCRMHDFQLGPFDCPEPIVALALSTQGMVGSKDYSGNIGNGILERFKCTFDYARHMLYLEPGSRFGTRDHYSRIGALLIKDGTRVLVDGVSRGSSADEAGMKEEDEIVTIDGRPALDFTHEDIDRLLDDGPAGTTHEFAIIRAQEHRTLTVTLRDIL
jgi:hypothetical protein